MTNAVKTEKNRRRLPLPAIAILFVNLLFFASTASDYERFERFYLINEKIDCQAYSEFRRSFLEMYVSSLILYCAIRAFCIN